MVVYSVLLSEVFLWYMLRPLTCNPQEKKKRKSGLDLVHYQIRPVIPNPASEFCSCSAYFPVKFPLTYQLKTFPLSQRQRKKTLKCALGSGSGLGLGLGNHQVEATWLFTQGLALEDEGHLQPESFLASYKPLTKKAKRRFKIFFFCPFQNSVSLFCEQPDFLYVCVFFNIVNKIPHIYRHFLFKIISIIYRILSFLTMYRSAKKVDFCPVLPRRYLCGVPYKKEFPFLLSVQHTPS